MAKQGRQIIERHNLVTAAPLSAGNRAIFSKELPVGEGYHSLILRFNFAVVIGTGAGPVVDGLYKAIRNIFMRTDRGEILANCPGKFWYFLGLTRYGTPPRSTPVAAATATYSCMVVIPFTDKKTMNPNDTILDTSRYSSMNLELNMGTLADIFTAPGTATMTMTVDIDVIKTRGLLPQDENALPKYHVSYDQRQPVDASVTTSIDLETSPDLAYKRLYLTTVTSGVAGLPFYGTFADTVISNFSLKDQSSDIVRAQDFRMLQADNAQHYGWDVGATPVTPSYPITYPAGFLGLAVVSFIGEAESLYSALYSGDKSQLLLNWINATAPALSIVTLGTESIRSLK
jgi:hypothetical protein